MGEETGRFTRSDRLLDSRDFRRVLRRGHRRADKKLVVITVSNQNNPNINSKLGEVLPVGSRLGITASRKVGNAVVRNLFKRRVRAWFRARRSLFQDNLDLVVIARRSGAALSFDQLDSTLSSLLELKSADVGTQ